VNQSGAVVAPAGTIVPTKAWAMAGSSCVPAAARSAAKAASGDSAICPGQSQIIIPAALTGSQHSILRVGEPLYSVYVAKQVGILTQDDINKKVATYGPETVGDPTLTHPYRAGIPRRTRPQTEARL
jgi:hypothetical protein